MKNLVLSVLTGLAMIPAAHAAEGTTPDAGRARLYVPAATLGYETHDDIGVISKAGAHADYRMPQQPNQTYSARYGTSLYGRAGVYHSPEPARQLPGLQRPAITTPRGN